MVNVPVGWNGRKMWIKVGNQKWKGDLQQPGGQRQAAGVSSAATCNFAICFHRK